MHDRTTNVRARTLSYGGQEKATLRSWQAPIDTDPEDAATNVDFPVRSLT
jgi:hypothetical protein